MLLSDDMYYKVDRKNHCRYEIKKGLIRKAMGSRDKYFTSIKCAFVLNNERVVFTNADRPTVLT